MIACMLMHLTIYSGSGGLPTLMEKLCIASQGLDSVFTSHVAKLCNIKLVTLHNGVSCLRC